MSNSSKKRRLDAGDTDDDRSKRQRVETKEAKVGESSTTTTHMSQSSNVSVNTIRMLSADTVRKANSGHPGAPMGMAPMAHVLWGSVMKYDPVDPKWANRDRFVLSNGHACALQYVMLHLTGYTDWTMDDLKSFRQIGSKTPGHPENDFPGIEVTTGPLGQGISNAVGLAIAEARLGKEFNKDDAKIVDNFTYVFCGDGCLQEGVSAEASSIAGHLGLGKLIVLYDDNKITIDGDTDLSFTEDVHMRYKSYGWDVATVENGDSDLEGILKAINAAKAVTDKPTLISVKTTIGFGSLKEGTHGVHGSPLSEEDIAQCKKKFGLSEEKFHVAKEASDALNHVKKGAEEHAEWNKLFATYKSKYPELAAEFERRMSGELPKDWKKALPKYTPADSPLATRKLGGKVINALADVLPELFGGSADLNPSCFTYLNKDTDFQKNAYGRNLRFGVREHGMVSILNGIAAYGGFIPFGSTFFNFIGYAYGAVILSALSHLRCVMVMTHDSIALGEDGPTHQAIEKAMLCRSTPNLLFFRPADGNETVGAWALAVENKHRPSVLALTRQNVPHYANSSVENTAKGGYVLEGCDGTPDIVIVGTGSEVEFCVGARKALGDLKVRVVSMPCWKLFDEQPESYRQSVFPEGVPVLAVEAGSTDAWYKYAHAVHGMKTFGASGPGKKVQAKFGFTNESIAEKAKLVVAHYKGKAVTNLVSRPF